MFLPFGNRTEVGSSEWRPEPTFRGTYGILATCLTTLSLCIWTALHLNIPGHNDGKMPYLRKAGMVLIGMFAPEMIAWTAYRQWRQARRINKLVKETFVVGDSSPSFIERMPFLGLSRTKTEGTNEILVEEGDSFQRPTLQSWSMVHSYYAVMGGFAVEAGDLNFFPLKQKHLALTPSAVILLAHLEPGIFPSITRAEIQDKSKSNALAKTIVCAQALWFTIQCFSRVFQGLAISLLELNTFIHALSAIIAYRLWWDKPLDIREPTRIKADQAREFFAFMASASRFGGQLGLEHPEECDAHGGLVSVLWNGVDLGLEYSLKAPAAVLSSVKEAVPEPNRLAVGDTLCDFKLVNLGVDLLPGTTCSCRLSRSDILRFELAAAAIRKYHRSPEFGRQFGLRGDTYHIPSGPDKLVLRMANLQSSWRAMIQGETFRGDGWRPSSLSVSISLAGLIYGGLHLLAWNAPFPTNAERMLWRISASSLAATGVQLYILVLSREFLGWIGAWVWVSNSFHFNRDEVRGFRKVLNFVKQLSCHVAVTIFRIVAVAYLLSYIFFRVFVVVESFLEVRNLPDTVFQSPSWSLYVPHIS